jgi:HSP20 family protein
MAKQQRGKQVKIERSMEQKAAGAKAPEEKRPAVWRGEPWSAPALASPFAAMRRLTEEMDRLFDDFRLGFPFRMPRLGLPPFEGFGAGGGVWAPSVEVAERGGKLVIRADLPGLTRNDVKVEVRDDRLCIQGERRQERESKGKGFFRSERSYGSFYREVPIPEGANVEEAKASFRNGVLEVTLPAPPAPKGRRVPIEE